MQCVYIYGMTRAKRLAIITDVVSAGPVPSQDALLQILAESGVQTTQATLSRDLREIGVAKTAAGYVLPGMLASPGGVALDVSGPGYGLRATGALERALRDHLIGVKCGVGIVVCMTAPGHAQVIALELDRTPLEGVLGTVAGDDTVFVAVDSIDRVRRVAHELRAMGGLGSGDAAADGGRP